MTNISVNFHKNVSWNLIYFSFFRGNKKHLKEKILDWYADCLFRRITKSVRRWLPEAVSKKWKLRVDIAPSSTSIYGGNNLHTHTHTHTDGTQTKQNKKSFEIPFLSQVSNNKRDNINHRKSIRELPDLPHIERGWIFSHSVSAQFVTHDTLSQAA